VTAYLGDSIAYRIRAELVCCYIYDQIRKEAAESESTGKTPEGMGVQNAIGRAVFEGRWHDICYWGEAAARIAEGQCPGHETIPNICHCSCEGCKHSCNAHQE